MMPFSRQAGAEGSPALEGTLAVGVECGRNLVKGEMIKPIRDSADSQVEAHKCCRDVDESLVNRRSDASEKR